MTKSVRRFFSVRQLQILAVQTTVEYFMKERRSECWAGWIWLCFNHPYRSSRAGIYPMSNTTFFLCVPVYYYICKASDSTDQDCVHSDTHLIGAQKPQFLQFKIYYIALNCFTARRKNVKEMLGPEKHMERLLPDNDNQYNVTDDHRGER